MLGQLEQAENKQVQQDSDILAKKLGTVHTLLPRSPQLETSPRNAVEVNKVTSRPGPEHSLLLSARSVPFNLCCSREGNIRPGTASRASSEVG